MPENTTLGPDMTLRMNCSLCERRRLCKCAAYDWWLCQTCRTRYDADSAECKGPDQPCACLCCWDGDEDSQWCQDNRDDVRTEVGVV